MNFHSSVRRSAQVVLVGLLALQLTGRAIAQTTIFEEPLSPRIANYVIDVTLDDVAKRTSGDIVLTWNNPSDDAISELQFHLYANAYRNAKSTSIRERLHNRARGTDGEAPSEARWAKKNGWGGVDVTRMSVDGVDVTDRIAFFQPDDDNVDDRTVIRVPLPTAIEPRGTAKIEMTFEGQIPRCKERIGWWQDDFFMMVHWFPKIGVYEPPGTRFVPADAPSGQWNCHQFHAATEFYADFGVYDVTITLPEKYVVGTTGLIVDERSNGDGTKTIVAHAEDVHEFAWVADAQFLRTLDVWQSRETGRKVNIQLLFQPGHERFEKKYLSAIQDTLDYVEEWLGPGAYPYPNVTVVDPRAGSGAGGMEYPTLITGGAFWSLDVLLGDGARIVEMVTIHEFMHQIWYGIVASNEFEEAWLDEGLTSYSDFRIATELLGDSRKTLVDWWGLTAGGYAEARGGYATSEGRNDGTIADWTFDHWRTGFGPTMAYKKSQLMLWTLDNYLGRERFDNVMRTYYQQWKFRHPSTRDFVAVANEVSGENLDWFFDQVIDQPTSLDYAAVSISNVPEDEFEKGILGDALELPPEEEDHDEGTEDESTDGDEDGEEEDTVQHSRVVFRRVGSVVFPMDVLIEFSDGEVVREQWDGRDRIKVYKFTRPAGVVRAAIDPDNKVPLDVCRLNNSIRTEPNDIVTNKYTLKGFFWMQSLLQFFGLLG